MGHEGRQIRAECNAGRTGQRGEIDDQLRRLPRRRAPAHRQESGDPPHRYCRSRRLSPLAARPSTSPGRKEAPEITFSTVGTSRRRHRSRPDAITICAVAMAAAAPPISFFIRLMAASGLMLSPPVSKVTPLPTRVTFGRIRPAPAQVDETRRTRRGPAHGMDHGQVFREQRLPLHDMNPGTKAPPEPFHGIRNLSRAAIIGRRVDQIPPQRDRLDDPQHGLMIEFRRYQQTRLFTLAAAIARETIGSHEKGQEIALRGPLKPIQSGRQLPGGGGGGFPASRGSRSVLSPRPNRTAPRCPLASGRRQTDPAPALNPWAEAKAAAGAGISASRSSNSSGATGWIATASRGGISFDQGMRHGPRTCRMGGRDACASACESCLHHRALTP